MAARAGPAVRAAGLVTALVGTVAGAQDAVVPAGFQGNWAAAQSRCMTSDEGNLTVVDDGFLFYESRARVLAVRQVSRYGTEFDLESSGEGQTWRDTRRYSLSADGNTLTDQTRAAPFVRVRCEQMPLPFVDQASSNPDFLAFRTRALEAVSMRDSAFIRSIVSERIRNSFGGDGGIAEFEDQWQLDADDSRFWGEFGEVLRLGGAFLTEDSFAAPYTFATWPDSLDAFEHFAVSGANVNVRMGPSLTSPVIASMSYQTVRSADDRLYGDWRMIQLSGGSTGYMNTRYARSPIDYRAIFERQESSWLLTAFIAGD